MTPIEFINFLLSKRDELDGSKSIVYGQSFNRCLELEPTDFEIIDGQLYLNTYEGM